MSVLDGSLYVGDSIFYIVVMALLLAVVVGIGFLIWQVFKKLK